MRKGAAALLILAVFAALLVSRKPDAFLAAQFWAEDGVVWYRQAYELGWASLLKPQNGYFQTVSKIAGNLAQWVPLVRAPLLFSLFALAFRLLPLALLFSSRGASLVPGLPARCLLGFLYVAHPYSWEVFVNVTNIHWHLAVAALLVLCFPAWRRPWEKIADTSIVLLGGLSGPFALFLAPIAAWHAFRARSRRSLVLAGILAACATIQLASILMTRDATRSVAPLDASWEGLVRIIGGQVAAASILGDAWRPLFDSQLWQTTVLLPLGFSVVLLAVAGRAFATGNPTVRSFIALSTMLFVAALWQPQISSTDGQWPLFTRPGTGGRYAFIPILGFYACLAWIAASDRIVVVRKGAQALLAAILVIGVPMSWSVRPYEEVGFVAKARAFEQAPPGTRMQIPVNPPGWTFPLRKR